METMRSNQVLAAVLSGTLVLGSLGCDASPPDVQSEQMECAEASADLEDSFLSDEGGGLDEEAPAYSDAGVSDGGVGGQSDEQAIMFLLAACGALAAYDLCLLNAANNERLARNQCTRGGGRWRGSVRTDNACVDLRRSVPLSCTTASSPSIVDFNSTCCYTPPPGP